MKKFTLFLSALLLALGATEAFGANPATMKVGQNASTCTVNGTDGIKVGTSNKAGDMSITVPANATSLQFYAAAWNKVNDLSLSITPEEKVSTSSIALTSDAGLSNNSPFTLSGDESSYYFEIDLKDITEETTLTFAASKRFVVWGATYTTDGTTPEEPETPTEPEDPETPTEPEQPEQPEGVLTCAEAVAICQETGETATTETYTIRGYVTNIASAYNAGYNNTSFWMADTKDGGKVFEAFRSTPLAEADKAVKVGDYVEVTGNLVNYKGNTPETAQGGTYTILEAAEGGEDPVEPEQPETPEEKPLTDGYTKVTNISALATGDKVVLYCDAYGVGVAGFDGYKSGIMAETGWVEYVVETVEGGIMLKDEKAGQYAALPEKNSFKYTAEGSVFTVTENALLACFLESESNTFFLYYNTNNGGNPLCRMYTDKSSDDRYAPFYVYEVTENTGDTTGVDNVTTNQNITKFFENGQLIIIKNGVKFNAQGQVVK